MQGSWDNPIIAGSDMQLEIPVAKPVPYIDFDGRRRLFHLRGQASSYLMSVSPYGDLHQLHWGCKLEAPDVAAVHRAWAGTVRNLHLETHRREYASFGSNDLRLPALHLEHGDGSRLSAFDYQGHEVLPGKPALVNDGLPGTTAEHPEDASTLRLLFKDYHSGHLLDLYYTIYPKLDVVVRRALLKQGPQAGAVKRLMSASLDFPAGDWHALSLPGDWARERMIEQSRLNQGAHRLESRRGTSSHGMSPFAVITKGKADEDRGEAFGISLIYSGNWLIEAEKHMSGRLRVNAGLNDFDFQWRLEPGATFASPECALAYSSKGLGGLSRKLHAMVRRHILRGPWRERERPILVNSWEAHYFKFKHDDIVKLAGQAKDIGADMVVLDDGWFGSRDSDNSSLGDWYDDLSKLPKGVKGLAAEVKAMGLKFGLWFEPEAVSPNSELYRKHPDWALAVPGRRPSTSRNQYVLDLGRPEVRDFLFSRLAHYVEDAGLDYIKWDMNRPLWEVGSPSLPAERQAELSHRYVLGLYELMGRLRDRFPELLVEGCSGGGGRFDWGMLCYHPQFWTSDNTDGLDRIYIQYGSSLFLPALTQTAHISEVPNHQTHRNIPITFRSLVALSGNLGLEINLAKTRAGEKREIKGWMEYYRKVRHLVNQGDFHRMESPYEGPRAAWCFVSRDKREVLAFAFQPRTPFRGQEPLPVRFKGLDPDEIYKLEGATQSYSGAFLMTQGLIPAFGPGDFQAQHWRLAAR